MEQRSDDARGRGPWRQGDAVVFDVGSHRLPPLCVLTGRRLEGEPTEVRVRYVPPGAVRLRLLVFIICVACSIVLSISLALAGLTSGLLSSAVIGAGAGVGLSIVRRLTTNERWSIPVYVDATRPRLSVLGTIMSFVVAPVGAMAGVVLSLAVQIAIPGGVVRSLATAATVLLFVGFLILFFWGWSRKADEKPRTVELTCRRFEGNRIWIVGVSQAVLDTLPEYPVPAGGNLLR